MTNAQNARLHHLLNLESPTPEEIAEADQLIEEGSAEFEAEIWEREQRQTLWAEHGGYAAGLARPV